MYTKKEDTSRTQRCIESLEKVPIAVMLRNRRAGLPNERRSKFRRVILSPASFNSVFWQTRIDKYPSMMSEGKLTVMSEGKLTVHATPWAKQFSR